MSLAGAISLNSRIRRDIEGKIRSGEWPPGYRIPYEHELMVEYACSRMTVNKVLTMLADAGMIERRRRAGSFVSRPHPHIEQVALDIPDIPIEVTSRGHQYRFQLLRRRVRKPKRGLAHELEIAGSGSLLSLQSLHMADERPFALEERLINTSVAPQALEMDFSSTAPGSWLLQHVSWTRAEHRISAIAADPVKAQLLQVEPGTACLVIQRQTWRGEQSVTFVTQVFLGASYDLIARFSPGSRQSRE